MIAEKIDEAGHAVLLVKVADYREAFEIETLRLGDDGVWYFTSDLSIKEKNQLDAIQRWAKGEADEVRKKLGLPRRIPIK